MKHSYTVLLAILLVVIAISVFFPRSQFVEGLDMEDLEDKVTGGSGSSDDDDDDHDDDYDSGEEWVPEEDITPVKKQGKKRNNGFLTPQPVSRHNSHKNAAHTSAGKKRRVVWSLKSNKVKEYIKGSATKTKENTKAYLNRIASSPHPGKPLLKSPGADHKIKARLDFTKSPSAGGRKKRKRSTKVSASDYF